MMVKYSSVRSSVRVCAFFVAENKETERNKRNMNDFAFASE